MSELDIDINNSEEYKIEAIWNNAVQVSKIEDDLPGLYYLVVLKDYPKRENILEPFCGV